MKAFTAPNQWPLWRDMTAKGYAVAFMSCFGAILYGYDISWWSSVLGMPEFVLRFGSYNSVTDTHAISPNLQSAGSAIPYATQFVGSLLTPVISDRWGRRVAMIIMASLYLVAVIIEVTSNSYWQVIGGRIINAIPLGMGASLLPMYQAECAPASCRGALVSIYTWFVDIGAVLATGIIYNTYARTDSGAYKIPMGIQGIFPLMILVAVWFVPESPRYLCMKGRDDEALGVLTSLRIDSTTAETELLEIQNGLRIHKEDAAWKDLFTGTNLRRTAIAVLIPVLEAWAGLSFIGNYLVVFFQSLGSSYSVYQLVVLINSVLLITLTCFFWAPDYFGRRTLLLIGSGVMGSCMYLGAGLGSKTPADVSQSRQTAVIAFLFIWSIVYSSTWANLTWLTMAEIPTTKLKAKTTGLGFACSTISSIIITTVSPYMQDVGYGGWGPYILFFFGSFSFVGFIFIWFFYPEVKGLTIEQLDVFFDERLSIAEFEKARLAGGIEVIGYVTEVTEEGEVTKQVSTMEKSVGKSDSIV